MLELVTASQVLKGWAPPCFSPITYSVKAVYLSPCEFETTTYRV